MKKFLFVIALTTISVFISSCSEEDPVTPPVETGFASISSSPDGAQIFLNGNNSGKVTPDSIELDPGTYTITLKLSEYFDTTFSVNVVVNQVTEKNITLNTSLIKFGPIRIWETNAPSTSKPSGLDLSSGQAIAVSGTDKMLADIYYTSNGFLVQSAHLNTTQGLTRNTKFKIGSSNNIDDGLDAPAVDNTWITGVTDVTTQYFYLYDEDENFSKARITGRGIDPDAYVEITWWYNRNTNDNGL